jgi:hypothetical protein
MSGGRSELAPGRREAGTDGGKKIRIEAWGQLEWEVVAYLVVVNRKAIHGGLEREWSGEVMVGK